MLLIKQIACMQEVRPVPLAYTRDCLQASVVHTFCIIGNLYKSWHRKHPLPNCTTDLSQCMGAATILDIWFLCFRISQECDQYSILLTKRKQYYPCYCTVFISVYRRNTPAVPIQCLHLHHHCEPNTNKKTPCTNILDLKSSFPCTVAAKISHNLILRVNNELNGFVCVVCVCVQ